MSQMSFNEDITLGEARAQLKEELDEGTVCPCCGQHAQIYRWSLYRSAIAMLERMYEAARLEFVESKTVKTGGSYSHCTQLKHWGLVENEKQRRPDGGRSGWWRVTPLGEQFLRRNVSVPKYVYVYDGEVVRVDFDQQITVTDVIADFDWRRHRDGTDWPSAA